MTRPNARLVYFDHWADDKTALDILAPAPTVDVEALSYHDAEPETLARMKGAHGYQIATRGQLNEPWFGNAALIEQCPSLLAITSTGSGYDMVDIDACTAAGIIVCNQTGSNAVGVAEHAVGLMIAVVKKFAVADRALHVGEPRDRFGYDAINLRGRTVGIVGIGTIGAKVAELCTAFGMDVVAYDPNLSPDDIKARGAVPTASLRKLLETVDIVTLHCPRTEETFGMFGAAEFAQMKAGAFFISTARGGVHDEGALHSALLSGHLAGAGLDVFLEEPPAPTHPLLGIDNVLATPHIAGLSVDDLKTMAAFAATQWLEIFAGRVPPRLVNPEAWPAYCDRFESELGFRPDPLGT